MEPNPTNNTFDAIVVGSGISGGWAAKELTEGGLKTLVLERGRMVKHVHDYPTAFKNPWDFEHGLHLSQKDLKERPIQSSHCNNADKHFYVKDSEHPYIQKDPFKWIRGYQVGGRSLTWGRQSYRLSDLDFEANKKDGHGVDWPIRYRDLEKWYDYVEDYVGISGNTDSIEHLPDGVFQPAIPMNAIEDHLKNQINRHYPDRRLIHGRVANLTEGKENRAPCQYRNQCSRGCPFGGYFSSNSATLRDAELTGNMTLKANSIVKEVLYDEQSQRATGVVVIDAKTKEEKTYYSRIIFLNASTIGTASILLNSVSERFPNGLGNGSDQVGRNLMDHIVGHGTSGTFDGLQDKYYIGRSPGTVLIPRFQNIDGQDTNNSFVRGYGLQGKGVRGNWQNITIDSIGLQLKEDLAKPGDWRIFLGGRGEILPYADNRVSLNFNRRDQWNMPLVKIAFQYGSNENAMLEHMTQESEQILRHAGFKNVSSYRTAPTPGSAVHEMGTARMGKDPKTSVLNQFNQMHEVQNVFITDGSAMTSSAWQNPSLTYMALTARACHHAIDLFCRKVI
ncbi:GMC oxidoreductase [Aureicoccus marinus]|uniref:GMC family oxidoreductase n=1 Tax=Aureicoccus marinus TaxID=754435 RepID=A0A2S7T9D5_9FLAO|nr:GMC family oxidoreductase [Aureicoccus marinus]PQJ16539.1 GMC family oxidoreductase [Aureicoccus marinus]